MKEIETLIRTWSEKRKLNGNSFDELFNIEGVPLWWFYKRFFVQHVMPKQVNTFNYMYQKKKIPFFKSIYYTLSSNILKIYLLINERRKIKYSRSKRPTEKPKVLFLTYKNHIANDGKIFRINNIINKIRGDNKIDELLLVIDPLSKKANKKSDYYNTYSYYNQEIANKAKKISQRLHKRWKAILENRKYELFRDDEGSLWPQLKYPLSFFLSEIFIYTLVLQYELFKKLIKEEKVKVVLLSASNGLYERCALAAAKKLNIPSLRTQHGIGKYFGNLYANPDLIGDTKLLVFSKIYEEKLTELGVDKKDIVIVGPVVFDDTVKYKFTDNNLSKDILLITSPFVEDGILDKEKYFLRMHKVIKSIGEISGAKITIKLHPRERYLEDYRNIINALNLKGVKILRDITREEYYKLISECKSFVSFGSSAAMEAVIIDRPMVTIDLLETSDGEARKIKNPLFMDSGITINVNYKENISKAIERSFKDEDYFKRKRRQFSNKMFDELDGKSYERVVEYIYSLIKVK